MYVIIMECYHVLWVIRLSLSTSNSLLLSPFHLVSSQRRHIISVIIILPESF